MYSAHNNNNNNNENIISLGVITHWPADLLITFILLSFTHREGLCTCCLEGYTLHSCVSPHGCLSHACCTTHALPVCCHHIPVDATTTVACMILLLCVLLIVIIYYYRLHITVFVTHYYSAYIWIYLYSLYIIFHIVDMYYYIITLLVVYISHTLFILVWLHFHWFTTRAPLSHHWLADARACAPLGNTLRRAWHGAARQRGTRFSSAGSERAVRRAHHHLCGYSCTVLRC